MGGIATNNYAGGIAGRAENVNMNNSCSIVTIKSSTTAEHSYIGQIAGANIPEVIIQDCYYFVKTPQYDSIGNESDVKGCNMVKQEEDMPNMLDIIGNAFKEDSKKYPILNWQ